MIGASSLPLLCVLLLTGAIFSAASGEEPCEEMEHEFAFQQHDERLDPNQFVKVLYAHMTSKLDHPVKKVALDYVPVLQRVVGTYAMYTTVSIIVNNRGQENEEVVDKCFHITYDVSSIIARALLRLDVCTRD